MLCYMIWDRAPSLAHALVKFSSMRFGGTCEIVIGHFKIMRVENQENGILISFKGVMLLAPFQLVSQSCSPPYHVFLYRFGLWLQSLFLLSWEPCELLTVVLASLSGWHVVIATICTGPAQPPRGGGQGPCWMSQGRVFHWVFLWMPGTLVSLKPVSSCSRERVQGPICDVDIKRLQGHFPPFIPVMSPAKIG